MRYLFSSQWRCESLSGTPLLRRLDPPRDNRPCDAPASSTGGWPLTVLTVRRSTVGELRRRPLVAAVHGESAAARRAKDHMTYARIPPDTLANCQPRTVMCRLCETPYGLVNAGPRSPARLSYRHAFTSQGFHRGVRRRDRTPRSLRGGSGRSQGIPYSRGAV